MDLLQSIMAERLADVEAARRAVSAAALYELAAQRTHHSLRARLRAGPGPRVIAEVKKASPSAGLLRPDYRPEELAGAYAAAGAVGISVLTEPRHFRGSEQHLCRVRRAVELPVLRKDFLGDPYQVAEAAAWGADVILLIVAALDPRRLRELYDEAVRLGLEVLAEAHTEAELEAGLSLEAAIVGVNSRDLKTLRTDLAVAERLARRIPAERLRIAESGIRTRADIERLEAVGYDGFLIGETLLAAPDPGARLRGLLTPAAPPPAGPRAS
jgi:indole-3-glycerol phosphate synthase